MSQPHAPYGPLYETPQGPWHAYGQDGEYGQPVCEQAYAQPYGAHYDPLTPSGAPEPSDPYGEYEGYAAAQEPEPGPVPDGPVPPVAPPVAPSGGRAAARKAAAGARGRGKPGRPGRPGRPVQRPDALRRLLPQALVVAFLAGGTSAFVAHDKAVRLSVDGTPRTLHTFADDVGELLEDEGLKVGAHDIVAPSPREQLANGDEIAVRYGRPLSLELDGSRRRVWTTARTVDGALDQLGVRAEGAYLSVSRGARIARRGLDLSVRTERGVTFVADGREHTVRTNAATVEEALDEAGIELTGDDTTSVALDGFPRDGQVIKVMRITGGQKVAEERIPYDTVRREDASLNKGTEVVERQGRPGLRRTTYRLRTVNGVKEKPKRIGTEVVRRPQARIVKVGTKPMPRSVAGADHLNWGGLAQCESGGRPDAVDPSGTYGGLYQFDTQTWRRLGGSGRPQDASGAEQTFRAKKLYVDRGASPWPHCGRRLTQ
ncbi:ubiquitin-like domain-containing protein [Streptomyces sp. NPDC054796]